MPPVPAVDEEQEETMQKRRSAMITSAAAVAIVAGLSLVGFSYGASSHSRHGEDLASRHHVMGGHGRGHGFARLCSDRREERLGNMIGLVESFADFTAAQTAAWDELTQALNSGSITIGATCDELKAEGRPETASERLAAMERMMESGLVALRQVRPAFDGFYAQLDEQQKQAIDKLASHRRGHH